MTAESWKHRPWADALRKKLSGDKLDKLAEKCIQMALKGDQFAMREIGERLDGKAKQALESEHTSYVVQIGDNQTSREQLETEMVSREGVEVSGGGRGPNQH